MYQRIGFQYLRETLFEDAGKALFVGELDPRMLISYFPELRGTLFDEDNAINLYAGVAEYMPHEASVDDISEFGGYFTPHLVCFPLPPALRTFFSTAFLNLPLIVLPTLPPNPRTGLISRAQPSSELLSTPLPEHAGCSRRRGASPGPTLRSRADARGFSPYVALQGPHWH